MEGDRSSPRSLVRLLGIFEAIAGVPDGLTLAELSVALKSPKSSLLTILRPLVAMGHLVHGGGRYRLGPAIFRFASEILVARRFPQLIRPIMADLVERSRETVFLTVIDRAAGSVTYVEGIDSPQAVRYSVPAGTTRPLHCSAAGNLLLAFQDEAWRAGYIATADLPAMTPRTITRPDRLGARVEEIRRSGLAVSLGEAIADAGGIAAPIFRPDGTVEAALLLAAPVSRMESRVDRLGAMLRDAADLASRAMGGRPAGLSRASSGRPTR